MAKYKDTELLEDLGNRLKSQRLKKRFLRVDVANKTGFAPQTIRDIEEGNETSLSYFTEVCKALEIHPKEIYDIEISLRPRNKTGVRKNRITSGIKELIEDGYFKKSRTSSKVASKLKERYEIETTSKTVASILKRQVDAQALESTESEISGTYLYIMRD